MDAESQHARLVDEFPGPRDRRCPFDPPPSLTAAREAEGLVRMRIADGLNPWIVTGYHDGRTVLASDAISVDPTRPGFPEKSDAFRATLGSYKNLRNMDDPEHGVQKRMLVSEFTIRRLSALLPAIERFVDESLADLAGGPRPVDLVRAFTLKVPIRVLCELLGVPYEDHEFFAGRTETAIGEGSYEDAAKASEDLKNYVVDLVALREREPDDSLISRLISQHVRPGKMSRQELIDTARLLIIAGFETTANQLGLSVLVLLQHPAVLAEIRDTEDPAVINNAVEELLRYLSVVHLGRRRAAVRDIEIAGQLIRAGESVIVAANTGDRDPDVFSDPDTLDIHRPNAKSHLAFGYGIHQCLGQQLSRLELRYAIPALLRALPDLRLAIPLDEIEFKEGRAVYGVASLPVSW